MVIPWEGNEFRDNIGILASIMLRGSLKSISLQLLSWRVRRNLQACKEMEIVGDVCLVSQGIQESPIRTAARSGIGARDDSISTQSGVSVEENQHLSGSSLVALM